MMGVKGGIAGMAAVSMPNGVPQAQGATTNAPTSAPFGLDFSSPTTWVGVIFAVGVLYLAGAYVILGRYRVPL